MAHDWKIGTAAALALFGLAFVTGEPAYGAELTPAQVDPSTIDGLASIVTERTGELCAFPILFDYGPDWVLTCANAPTVWTLAADGNLYQNGDLQTAFERNFR